jgi:aspartate aminotransferase
MDAPGVISLAHGNGVRRPHPSVLAAAIEACRGDAGWSFDDYHSRQPFAPLEAAIRRDAAGSFVERSAVCVGAGTAQLMSAYLATRARPGDALLVVRPHYHGVVDWCTAAGVRPVVVRTTRSTAYRGEPRDFDDAHRRATIDGRRVCGVLLTNPTFTGGIYSTDELTAIADWARDRQIRLLIDTAFRRTEYPGHPTAPAGGGAVDVDPQHAIVFAGVSKAHNLANLRVGWAIADPQTVADLDRHRDRTFGVVPFLNQAMAAAALAAPATYLRENAAECAARFDIVKQWVADTRRRLGDVLRVEHDPAAGHAALLSADALAGAALPDGHRLRTSVDLCRFLLQSQRVAVSPAYSHGLDSIAFRVSYASVGLKDTYAASRQAERAAIARAAGANVEATVAADAEPFADGRRWLSEALDRVAAGIAEIAR